MADFPHLHPLLLRVLGILGRNCGDADKATTLLTLFRLGKFTQPQVTTPEVCRMLQHRNIVPSVSTRLLLPQAQQSIGATKQDECPIH